MEMFLCKQVNKLSISYLAMLKGRMEGDLSSLLAFAFSLFILAVVLCCFTHKLLSIVSKCYFLVNLVGFLRKLPQEHQC